MNNRPSDASQAAFADLTSKEGGSHLLRIIIESRFIILANLQALERPASGASLNDRSVLQTVSSLNQEVTAGTCEPPPLSLSLSLSEAKTQARIE